VVEIEVKLNANISVHVWQAEMYLESVFRTGGKLGAAPNYDRNSIERAAELGYSGHEPTWQMSRAHELLHHYLSIQLGQPWSWTLWWEAHKTMFGLPRPPRMMYLQEELLVFAMQRHLNGRGLAPELLLFGERLPTVVAGACAMLEPLESLHDAA
jgi:hypothetical protein